MNRAFCVAQVAGAARRCFTPEMLKERLTPAETAVQDPVYKTVKRYRGFWLPDIGDLLGEVPEGTDALEFRAADGYKTRISLNEVRQKSPRGLLAFRDASYREEWEPFMHGKERITPGPWYLVWEKTDQVPVHSLPWPYQVVEIGFVNTKANFAAISPENLPDSAFAGAIQSNAVRAGFALFEAHCLKCHSVNLVGGTLGPELNYPRNITEYWPRETLLAFIRDPNGFRARSKMPAFGNVLSEEQLEQVRAYLEWIAEYKNPVTNT